MIDDDGFEPPNSSEWRLIFDRDGWLVWQPKPSASFLQRLHKAIAISDQDPAAEPVQHPWGGAF